MTILSRITARWLVGLLAVLTVLAHVSDAGRTARSGFDLGQPVLSSGDHTQPRLAADASQGEIRFRAVDTQPHVGGKAAGDAILAAERQAIAPGRSRATPVRPAAARVRAASVVPGQRAPPAVLPTA